MDRITKEKRSANMRNIKSKDMKPEMIVRRLVYKMGYRYRLHRHDLPGRPDLVFVGRKKIIFVHGCYWHQHQEPTCPLTHKPKTNKAYWSPKLNKNSERDKNNRKKLKEMGWDVLVIWECQLRSELLAVEQEIKAFLEAST